jgi:hypothetical protein
LRSASCRANSAMPDASTAYTFRAPACRDSIQRHGSAGLCGLFGTRGPVGKHVSWCIHSWPGHWPRCFSAVAC